MRLNNKIAIITGSSRGIGRATALMLAKEGAKVVVNCKESVALGKRTADEIRKMGGEAIFIKADISRQKEVKKLFEAALEKFQTVDILVNNATAPLIIKSWPELTLEDWEMVLSTNVYGTFFCSKEASKIMAAKRRGKIINIASLSGLSNFGIPRAICHSAAKAAIINFTKTLAKELAPHIQVNAIAPGMVETERTISIWNESIREETIKRVPIKRYIKPNEVAEAIIFLASDASSAITGEVLVVAGGLQLNIFD